MLGACQGEAEVLAAACERGTLAMQHGGHDTFKMCVRDTRGHPCPSSHLSPHAVRVWNAHVQQPQSDE